MRVGSDGGRRDRHRNNERELQPPLLGGSDERSPCAGGGWPKQGPPCLFVDDVETASCEKREKGIGAEPMFGPPEDRRSRQYEWTYRGQQGESEEEIGLARITPHTERRDRARG